MYNLVRQLIIVVQTMKDIAQLKSTCQEELLFRAYRDSKTRSDLFAMHSRNASVKEVFESCQLYDYNGESDKVEMSTLLQGCQMPWN